MIIEPKDVKKYLSTKGKIVVTAKHANSLAKGALQKFKNGFKNALKIVQEKAIQTKDSVVNATITAKDGVVNTATNIKDKVVDKTTTTMDKIKASVLPDEEVIQSKTEEVRENKIEKIDNKRYELTQLKKSMEQDEEYRIGINNCYLKEIENELRKLNNKKMKVSKKGLGVFALTKLTLSNVKGNIKRKWDNYLEKREQLNKQKELETQKLKLAENLKEQLRLQNESRSIIEQNPAELNAFFNELIQNYRNQENQNTETTQKKL